MLRRAINDQDKDSLKAMFPCLKYDIERYYSLLENDKICESSIKFFNRFIKSIKTKLNELGFSIDSLLKNWKCNQKKSVKLFVLRSNYLTENTEFNEKDLCNHFYLEL